MKLEAETPPSGCGVPFGCAWLRSATRETILVHLHDEAKGIGAHGEGALPPYILNRQSVPRLADPLAWRTILVHGWTPVQWADRQ